MSSTIKTGSYRQSDTTRCLPKQGIITAQLSRLQKKVKQNNGKENAIIRFKQNNGNENVYTHIFQGYILPKDKQSMVSMTG